MQDLKKRFMEFAINTGLLIQQLPKSIINGAYAANQLVRCASSPGTNYRAALRGKFRTSYFPFRT